MVAKKNWRPFWLDKMILELLHTPRACLRVIYDAPPIYNPCRLHSSFLSTHEWWNGKWELGQRWWYLWLLLGNGHEVNMGMWLELKLDKSPSLVTAAAAKSLQLCLTLCDPIDGSPPGSLVPGILQARTLEWVAISFSNASKWKVKSESEVAQSCPTLSDPMDCSPPGSSVHGIFPARVLEWGAIAFSEFGYYLLSILYWQELRYYYKCFHSFNPSQSLFASHKRWCCLTNSHKWSVRCELGSGDE